MNNTLFGKHIKEAMNLFKKKKFIQPCCVSHQPGMVNWQCEVGWGNVTSDGTMESCTDKIENCSYSDLEDKPKEA